MALITQTTNPLHFEDLDPNRFEDLVRQLIYDLKNWEILEATGRSGADEGFDIRGVENLTQLNIAGEEELSENESDFEKNYEKRIWLIQCKREKSIAPKKIEKYLKDIFEHNHHLYGFIFVASCNFSKKTRDTFTNIVRRNRIQEFQIYGNSELEDMLFQPKNDHLLFAYFGFSLAIRQKSKKIKIRSRLATKNKLGKIFGEMSRFGRHVPKTVLLRDVTDELYPYSGEINNFNENPPWRIFTFIDYEFDGPMFLIKKCYAYYDKEKNEMDAMNKIDINEIYYENPWENILRHGINGKLAKNIWTKIPENNKGYILVKGKVSFDRIVAIDEKGDNIFEGPHFFIESYPNRDFFEPYIILELYDMNDNRIDFDFSNLSRIKYFPDEFRKV
jgi:hypothetical protein